MGFGKIFKKVKRFALPAIGGIIGGPVGAGLGSLAAGGSIKDALLSGVGTYAGSSFGNSLFGASGSIGNAGTIGELFAGASNVGPQFLNTGLGSSIGASIANTGIGAAVGGFAGSQFAGNAMPDDMPEMAAAPAGPAPFMPKQEEEQSAPSSLAGLTPLQQSTNLATQGVYGGGTSPQDTSYFLNMMNRRLVDPAGKVNEQNNFAPIETSFLDRLGLGGMKNSSSLLEAISKWRTQNPSYA